MQLCQIINEIPGFNCHLEVKEITWVAIFSFVSFLKEKKKKKKICSKIKTFHFKHITTIPFIIKNCPYICTFVCFYLIFLTNWLIWFFYFHSNLNTKKQLVDSYYSEYDHKLLSNKTSIYRIGPIE